MSQQRPDVRPGSAPVVDADNPWPGLSAFSEEFKKFFFGRSVELDDLFRRVRRESLTVLYAQSGLGKTSLLQAGLFPRLREEGFLPVEIRLGYGEAEPGSRPGADPPSRQIVQRIAAAISARGLGEASDPLAAPGVWEYLHDVKFALPDETGIPLTPVLVFDQFEELFTLGAERRDDGRFAEAVAELLGDLIENRPPRALDKLLRQNPALVDRYDFTRQNCRFLLSLREDYLPHLHGLRAQIPSIIMNNVRLTRFDRRQALEVVERPAAERGLVTRTVAEAIVRTVAGRDSADESAGPLRTGEQPTAEPISPERTTERLEVDPALLSLFCQKLNLRRIERGEATISLELVARSKETVLQDFYLDCFQDLSPPPEPGVKAFVEDYLLTSKGYRDRLTLERATEILVTDYHGRAEELGILVDRRLLQVEERGKTPQIELTHDVLAPVALRGRTERVHQDELRQAEERRQAQIRHAEQEEREARARAEAAAAALTAVQRQQRRTRALLAIAAVAAVVAGVSAVLAGRATQKAERAEATAIRERDAQVRLTATANAERARAETERARAETERNRSTVMLGDFCDYALKVVNRFGDSTAKNSALQKAFNSLVEISDASVDLMVRRNTGDLCPRQLDARVTSISANLRYELNDTTGSIARGRHGLEAAARLRPYLDSTSRWITTRSFSDLLYTFFFDRDYPDALRAAHAAIPLVAAVDPRTDSAAFDRHARVYHYGALALIRSAREAEGEQWIARGLAVVDQGMERRDQVKSNLLFTRSQLWMRQSEADSARNRTDAGLAAMHRAVDAARSRFSLVGYPGNRKWLAEVHGWHAARALRVRRFDEALVANDSSIANWDSLVVFGHRSADTTWIAEGLRTIGDLLMSKAFAYLGQGRVAPAVAAARAGRDSLAQLVRIQGSFPNQHALATTLESLGIILDLAGERAAADTAYRREFLIDSTIAELPTTGADEMWIYYGTLGRLSAKSDRRARADTVGKDSTAKVAILRGEATAERQYREMQVALARRLMRGAYRQARSRADSLRIRSDDQKKLAQALGNLSWSELQTGRPEQAVSDAKEAIALAPGESYILVNLFNALVLSGLREEAAAFFRSHADQTVETIPIPFPCAVERDIADLLLRATPLPGHVSFVAGLAAPYRAKCPKPTS